MKVRRSTLGGYWLDGKRVPSVTEILKNVSQDGNSYASQNIVINRLEKFLTDAQDGLFPASFLRALDLWDAKASSVTILRWLDSEEGKRWIGAAYTKQTNGYKDRGTLLHRFKDELSVNPIWSQREIEDWLEDALTGEREQSKMTYDEYKQFSESDPEKLKFKEWHDRYAHGRPERPYDCEPEDVLPYLLSLNRWWQDEAPEFLWVERVLIGKGFAGTADGLCVWRGQTWLADFKSRGSSGVKPVDGMQLGGYSLCTHYYDPEKDSVEKLDWEGFGCVVFVVTPEKVYPYVMKDLKQSQKFFKYELAKQQVPTMFYTTRESESMTKETAIA